MVRLIERQSQRVRWTIGSTVAVVGTLVLGTSAAAQSPTNRVSLTATVPPQAVIEDQRATVRRVSGDTAEYAVHLVIRANAAYRVVARRAARTGIPVLFLRDGQGFAQLDPQRRAVQIGRGGPGLTTFDFGYRIDCSTGATACGVSDAASKIIAFKAAPDPSVAPR